MTLVEKTDMIMNAVEVGMTIEDAYIYAGLTPEEIAVLDKDDHLQRQLSQCHRVLEYKLLNQMQDIAQKQIRMGKEGATTWMLEKLFPRYSSKPQDSSVPVTINLGQKDPALLDTVSITGPVTPSTEATEATEATEPRENSDG